MTDEADRVAAAKAAIEAALTQAAAAPPPLTDIAKRAFTELAELLSSKHTAIGCEVWPSSRPDSHSSLVVWPKTRPLQRSQLMGLRFSGAQVHVIGSGEASDPVHSEAELWERFRALVGTIAFKESIAYLTEWDVEPATGVLHTVGPQTIDPANDMAVSCSADERRRIIDTPVGRRVEPGILVTATHAAGLRGSCSEDLVNLFFTCEGVSLMVTGHTGDELGSIKLSGQRLPNY
jgi:hypothetical protein